MKLSEIFERAAKNIEREAKRNDERGEVEDVHECYCCMALGEIYITERLIGSGEFQNSLDFFRSFFRRRPSLDDNTFGYWGVASANGRTDNITPRIIAMQLCAELAKEQGL